MFEAAILKTRTELLATEKDEEPEGTRGAVQVFLRKRPLFEKDMADLKTPFITHVHFGFDCVFPEDLSNDAVYSQTAETLVQIALNGGMATMFMFGQTGSGKTFTMTAIEELAARDLFGSKLAEERNSLPVTAKRIMECWRCFDLLVPAAAARDTRQAASRRGEPPPELRLRRLAWFVGGC
eukprot:g26423.t1